MNQFTLFNCIYNSPLVALKSDMMHLIWSHEIKLIYIWKIEDALIYNGLNKK